MTLFEDKVFIEVMTGVFLKGENLNKEMDR
jgi:hypothetical protein